MNDDEICWLPVREPAALVRDRKLSATELVSAHLARIEAVNPALNVLHGVPAGFKDTHDTAGMRTTYGSPLPSGLDVC
jgi:amidase